MKKSRTDQIKRASKLAHRAARRQHKPKIVQVPAAWATPENQSQRSIVIPAPTVKANWSSARARGRAYARVLDGKETWPKSAEDRVIRKSSARPKRARQDKHQMRALHKFGMFWASKLDGLIEKRAVKSRPAYSTRKPSKGLIVLVRDGHT